MIDKNMWHFFYDEAFHDRKIKTKDNLINIYRKNASDVYVGVFIGCKSQDLQLFYDQFIHFECKYKEKFDLKQGQELKGTIIKKKNFMYGISSFNKNCFEYYDDYFSILNDNMILHIGMFSKTAFFITQAFETINVNIILYNKNAFLYSLIKFLYNYRYNEFLLKLFCENKLQSSKEILDQLRQFIGEVINRIYDIKKKKRELHTLTQLQNILEHASIENISHTQYLWNYKIIFEGLNLLLKERGIEHHQVVLVIDREKHTYEAAIETGKYFSVKEDNSDAVEGIRASDILSNFIGRMILALDQDLREGEIKNINNLHNFDFATKRLLNPKWFELNEQKFGLYKKINNIFQIMQKYEWTTYGSIYFDYSTLIFTLIQYIGEFQSYNDFIKINKELHSEYFNTYCCKVLEMRFEEF